MAKPDIDDGWYKKSIELEAALDFADFTKYARVNLRYAFAQLFGRTRARPKFVHLPCSEIANRIGRPRQHVFRGREELIASNVLVPSTIGDDIFSFVKDYERWTLVGRLKGSFVPTDRPRLTPEEIADCRDAVAYWKGCEHASHLYESVINRDDAASSRFLSLSSIWMTPRHPDSSRRHQSGCHGVISIDDKICPPLEPPSRKRELEKEREREIGMEMGERPRAPEGPSAGDGDRGDEPFIPPPPVASIQAPETAEHRALAALMLKATRSDLLPGGNADAAEFAVQQFESWKAQGYPVAIVKDAIRSSVKVDGLAGNLTAWSRWVGKKLGGYAASRASLPDAPAKAPAKPKQYHVAAPRPQPPADRREGTS